jgi:hypothetical protein
MKKFRLFVFSSMIAVALTFYSKRAHLEYTVNSKDFKTFEKKSNQKAIGHQTTIDEFKEARISTPSRSIAEVKTDQDQTFLKKMPKDRLYKLKENRVLISDTDNLNNQDDQAELEMVNKINLEWKDILGNDLLRFQGEDTKVIVKEEYPLIKIQNVKGLYLEQVIITYLFKDGGISSFHALVDSETGFVTKTWDRTINEKIKKGSGLTLPEQNNSGIIAR